MTAVNGDISIIAGINVQSDGSPAIGWRFSEELEPTRIVYDLTGKDVYLKITWSETSTIEHDSIEAGTPFTIDIDEGIVYWLPTIAETLEMPRGRIARYRLEWRQAASGGSGAADINGFLASGFVIVGDGTPDIE